MEDYQDLTNDTSFFVRDTAYSVASVASFEHQVPAFGETADSALYYILALAQSRNVDFLPIIHQPALGHVGAGLTAVVNQCFINDDFALAFKEVGSAAAFLHELSFVSARTIRIHPFMTTLQGVCWDVDGSKQGGNWLIKPVLVFEKATKSNLWSFMQTEEGQSLTDTQRISLCIQLAIALSDLEEYRVIHGDIKPKNILVFKENNVKATVTIQLADFGHSTSVPAERPVQLVYLPESRPWSIPPNEYHHRGFTFLEARRAMTYSFAVCCIWLLFYNHGSHPDCNFTKDSGSLDSNTMLNIATEKLDRSANLYHGFNVHLRELFDLTLAADPNARSTSVAPLLQILRNCFEICRKHDKSDQFVIVEKPPKSDLGIDYAALQNLPDHFQWFDVSRSMVQLFEVDYRVREMIFTSLTIRHEEISLDPQQARLTDSLSLEIAKCFWLGFGTKRNEALARTWLSKTSLNSEFDSHIAGIKTALHSNYLWWTKLTQLMSIGHIQFTNDMQYYRDQKQTREILAIERRELEDWNEALGPAHFIVSQRGAMLFEKLANLGMRNEALHLLQNMYEECNSALPSDHPRIKNLLAILAKAHLMNDEKTASRKFLFTLYPELQNPADRADIIGKQSDAAFLNHASNYALLAATEDAMHNYKEAESLYKLILPRMCRLLGTQNLQCIKTQYNLGMVYHNQGQYTEAWQLFDPLYRITVSSVGETHEMSLLIAEKRVELQARLRLHRTWVGRWVNRQIQLGFEKAPIETSQITLGNSHPYTIEAINRGVEALAGATRYDEAVKLAKCAVEIVEKRSGKESHDAETQRKKLAGVRRTASLHWAFFRWGSWTLGPNEPKRIRGVIVGWKRRVFEPFELDFSLDPNYQIEN